MLILVAYKIGSVFVRPIAVYGMRVVGGGQDIYSMFAAYIRSIIVRR